jgi:DNA-binding response OmpR family regulator
LWRADDVDIPNDRTIDVHVRRLRSKLGRFEDIVRTVRGEGYRFDAHPDVTVLFASAPSPDVF